MMSVTHSNARHVAPRGDAWPLTRAWVVQALLFVFGAVGMLLYKLATELGVTLD